MISRETSSRPPGNEPELRRSEVSAGVATGVSKSAGSCQPTFSGGYLDSENVCALAHGAADCRLCAGDGSLASCSSAARIPMYLVSLCDFSIRSGRPMDPEEWLDSHQRLAALPLELSSSGTVLCAMLGMGDSVGLNVSGHCLDSARSNASPASPTEATSVAGVFSPKDEADFGKPCAEAG